MSHPHLYRKASTRQLERKPHVLWNEYVDLLAMSDYALTQVQRIAHLAFWYDAEVQNGGHLQYFENKGITRVDETIAALRNLGAQCQSEVLSRASIQFLSRPRARIPSASEYIEIALQGEFDEFDQAYHACHPEITELLKTYLEANEAEFIKRVE